MAVPRLGLGEIAGDVLEYAALECRNDGAEIMLAGPLDRLLAAGERDPNRRMRTREGPRPDGDVFVGPEFALVRKDVLRPGLQNDVDRLLEARTRFCHGHAVDAVFARYATRKTRQDASAREAIGHCQFFGDAQWIVQRQ